MNEAHRNAKLEKTRTKAAAKKNEKPTVKKKGPTNTPKIISTNYDSPPPSKWMLYKERCRTFSQRTGCFEYLLRGSRVTRKELRAHFLCA